MRTKLPLIIFAKAPVAGEVKTRLTKHCSAEQAAKIAELLLIETLNASTQHWPGEVIIATWPDSNHPIIQALAARFGVRVVVQTAGDLGEKMAAVMHAYGYPAAIIGSDAPHITAQSFATAYTLLSEGNNIIGPSDDGGYYLLGLSRPEPQLFENIPWGTERVLAPSLSRAEFKQLSNLNDVDTWQDLLAIRHRFNAIDRYLKEQVLTDQD